MASKVNVNNLGDVQYNKSRDKSSYDLNDKKSEDPGIISVNHVDMGSYYSIYGIVCLIIVIALLWYFVRSNMVTECDACGKRCSLDCNCKCHGCKKTGCNMRTEKSCNRDGCKINTQECVACGKYCSPDCRCSCHDKTTDGMIGDNKRSYTHCGGGVKVCPTIPNYVSTRYNADNDPYYDWTNPQWIEGMNDQTKEMVTLPDKTVAGIKRLPFAQKNKEGFTIESPDIVKLFPEFNEKDPPRRRGNVDKYLPPYKIDTGTYGDIPIDFYGEDATPYGNEWYDPTHIKVLNGRKAFMRVYDANRAYADKF